MALNQLIKVSLALLIAVAAPLSAQTKPQCLADRGGNMICPPPDGRCLADRYGEVICSSSGGGITPDRYGNIVCGPGYCAKNSRGDVMCSKTSRGAASIDRYGEVACTDGCIAAQADACSRQKR